MLKRVMSALIVSGVVMSGAAFAAEGTAPVGTQASQPQAEATVKGAVKHEAAKDQKDHGMTGKHAKDTLGQTEAKTGAKAEKAVKAPHEVKADAVKADPAVTPAAKAN